MLADGDGRIDFRPSISLVEMHALLRDCDAVVLPSLWESWPYVALEALQANRPIIATPVGGFVEIVRPGASGWLTEDTSVESLATLIERLLYSREEVERLRLEGLPAGVFASSSTPSRSSPATASCWTAPAGGLPRPREPTDRQPGRGRPRGAARLDRDPLLPTRQHTSARPSRQRSRRPIR